jgi:hypothetical protein
LVHNSDVVIGRSEQVTTAVFEIRTMRLDDKSCSSRGQETLRPSQHLDLCSIHIDLGEAGNEFLARNSVELDERGTKAHLPQAGRYAMPFLVKGEIGTESLNREWLAFKGNDVRSTELGEYQRVVPNRSADVKDRHARMTESTHVAIELYFVKPDV